MQVIILRNDNASGIIRLSSSTVSVKEDTRGTFLNIVRSGGLFGQVLVTFFLNIFRIINLVKIRVYAAFAIYSMF